MNNNIISLINNSKIDANNLLEFSKSFIFKNKFSADTYETKSSLYYSQYYVKACLYPLDNIPFNLPTIISAYLPNIATNKDVVELYIRNTYYSIINEEKGGDIFSEQNSYYQQLFINQYNNLIGIYGNFDESYEYNMSLLEINNPDIKDSILYFIYNSRIYNHLDILYCDKSTINIDLPKFITNYHINKIYFLKTIYTEGFEIQENYFNFCKFFITFMTIQQYITDKTEIVFNIDLLEDYSIINFLYSYGIYFLDDLPIYSQRRVIKNIQRLLSNKGNNQVIANILDIFELPDNIVFKYYMEKDYSGTQPDIKFVGIPYSEYSYTKYIDSGVEKNTKPFDYFINYDKSWKTTKDYILEQTNNVDFDYVETKYLSVESSFEIQTFAAECAFFFDTIYKTKEYQNNLLNLTKVKTTYSSEGFNIFDGIITLATLSMLVNRTEPIIFKTPFMNNRHSFIDNIEQIQGIVYYDNLTLSSSFTKTGINISNYYGLNNIKTENLDSILTKINNNFSVKNDLEDYIVNIDNYEDFVKLQEDYNKLFVADSNRNYFTEYDNYIDYLKDVNIDLYNFISPVYKTNIEKDILKKFNTLVQDLKDFLDNNNLVWDIPYRETIIKYLYYTIDYFKSYTVQLTDLKIIFRFNNKLENKLFLLDKGQGNLDYIINSKIADLVGGELYEFQERPLSLHDNFYNNGYKYRDINNTLVKKDSVKNSLKDNYIINIL